MCRKKRVEKYANKYVEKYVEKNVLISKSLCPSNKLTDFEILHCYFK